MYYCTYRYYTGSLFLWSLSWQDTMQPTDVLAPSLCSWIRRVIGRDSSRDIRTVQDFLFNPNLPKLEAALYEAVGRANDRADSRAARVQKLRILPKELSVVDGELSPTLKVKRFHLNEKYSDLIEDMYKEGEEDN